MDIVFDIVNPFTAKGFPHWRVKLSGVRQSKIYNCPVGTYGSERVLMHHGSIVNIILMHWFLKHSISLLVLTLIKVANS